MLLEERHRPVVEQIRRPGTANNCYIAVTVRKGPEVILSSLPQESSSFPC